MNIDYVITKKYMERLQQIRRCNSYSFPQGRGKPEGRKSYYTDAGLNVKVGGIWGASEDELPYLSLIREEDVVQTGIKNGKATVEIPFRIEGVTRINTGCFHQADAFRLLCDMKAAIFAPELGMGNYTGIPSPTVYAGSNISEREPGSGYISVILMIRQQGVLFDLVQPSAVLDC